MGLIPPNLFEAGLDELIRIGWIEQPSSGKLSWRADPLKEVLVKYVARSRGVPIGGFARRAIHGGYLESLVSQLPLFAKFGPHELDTGDSGSPCDRIPQSLCGLLGAGLWVLQIALSLDSGERCSAITLVPASADGREELLLELEARVARANAEGARSGIRWELVRQEIVAKKAWTGSTEDWLFCFEQPELLARRIVMVPWLRELCDSYVEGDDVRSVIHRAAAAVELLPLEVLPNLGYMALATGVGAAKAILDRAAEHLVGSLISYNQALACLLGPEPDVKGASERLSKVLAGDDDDFRVALRLRCTTDSIEMYEHAPSEASAPKRVGDLVLEALAELKKVVAGAPVVRVARPNGVSK